MANLNDTIISGVLVVNGIISGTANLKGISTAQTASEGTNTDQIATTKFVMNALQNNKGISFNIVNTRPDIGEDGVIYLVPNGKTTGDNQYNKYFYLDNRWEELGNAIEVIDNLVSKDSEAVLSANQGRILNEKKIDSSDRSVKNIISLTEEQYNNLKSNNKLIEGTIYNITDDVFTGSDTNNSKDLIEIDYVSYTNYNDASDITELVPSETFDNIYNNKYTNIMCYDSRMYSGNVFVTRYYIQCVITHEHDTYNNLEVINMTFSNNVSINISKDTDTNIVYKGENGSHTSSGGLACFTENTLINTNKGLKFIKDIQLGDKVLSYNFKTNKSEYKEVNNIYTHKSSIIYKIEFEDDVIQTTFDEPFYTEGTRVMAQFLSKGDKLFSKEGIQEVVGVSISRNRNELVYDLSVKDNYNYFVSKNNILVFTEDVTKKEE